MFSNCYKFHLLLLLFVGSYGIRIAYQDGDVQLNPAPKSTTNPEIRTRVKAKPQQYGLPNAADRKDIQPQLFGSIRGLPGIEFRINPRGFSYASLLASPIISNEIKRTRLPGSRQCFREFNGCITMYNLFISRYRCPQLVSIYPNPPNRLFLTVRNLDFEITGNLGGELEVILPITVNGIVHISAHQVSVTTQLTIHRASDGSPYARVLGCYVSLASADVVVQNAGLVGDVFNSQFRGTAAEQVRRALPSKICVMIPNIIHRKLNPRLRKMQKKIPFSTFTSLAEYIIFGNSSTADSPEHCNTPLCEQKIQDRDAITHLSAPTAVPVIPQNVGGEVLLERRRSARNFAGKENAVIDPIPWTLRSHSTEFEMHPLRTVSATILTQKRNARQAPTRTTREANDLPQAHPLQSAKSSVSSHHRSAITTTEFLRRVTLPPMSSAPRINARTVKTPTLDPCTDCFQSSKSEPIHTCALRKTIDMKKLADLALNMQLLKTSATPNDFIVGVSGEFSPRGNGGTPFHPFPMKFPRTRSSGNRMMEALISDYTINTLLYYMHKRDFISFRIGPETPKVGELLKTTCDEGDYDELDDSGVDDDEDFEDEHTTTASMTGDSSKELTRKLRKREATQENNEGMGSSLEDLGVCLGDIMPAVREKYPKKLLHIKVHTTRAPSVILSARKGGIAKISIEAEAGLYIDDSGEKVGTIVITSNLEASIHTVPGNRIIGVAEIQLLKLIDKQKTLGLPQDALDNLANIGKEVVSKIANDALSKGVVVQLPTWKLLYNFEKPRFAVVEHAIHFASDFKIPLSTLGITSSSICRRF